MITCGTDVLVAARKRGITLQAIAAAAGISHQAVSMRLKRAGFDGSQVEATGRRHSTDATQKKFVKRSSQKCIRCGKVRWITTRDAKRLDYCSSKCRGADDRHLSDEDVIRAIEMRQWMTWRGVGKAFKKDAQVVQVSIWRYLHENDLLTYKTVSQIWTPRCSIGPKNPKWRWLINRTGWEPR